MVEYNVDSINGFSIIVAPNRSKRPKDEFEQTFDSSKNCQFCPGNEHFTPPETYIIKGNDQQWIIRSLPNKYPTLYQDTGISKSGIQEVLIETNNHHIKFENYQSEHLCKVIGAYKNRIESFKKNNTIQYVIAFKNSGKFSGATLEHEHSQIVGLNFVPGQVIYRDENLKQAFHETGKCYYCELITKSNIVYENNSFICLMPNEARFSYETWIIPKDHESYFENITETQIPDLAEALLKITKTINSFLKNSSYNIVLNNGLYNGENNRAYMHWNFQFIPRTSFLAGFELGTGLYIRQNDHKKVSAQIKMLIEKN